MNKINGTINLGGVPHEMYERIVNYVKNTKSPYSPNYHVLEMKEAKISEDNLLTYNLAIEIIYPDITRGNPHPEEINLLSEKVEGLVNLIFPEKKR